jgi:outer membrane protein assembly factor BamB
MIFMLGLAIFGCQPILPSGVWQTSMTSTPSVPAPAKQITLNTLPLVERWRWSGNTANLSISLTDVTVTKDRIVVIGRESKQRVIVFDSHTGNFLWQSEPIANIRSVAADEERVYIGTITYVQAFDLETGQELWRGAEQPSMKRGGFAVYSKKDWLEVYDILEPVVYILDAVTGQIVDEIPKSLFFRWDEVDYSIVRGNYLLEARDVTSNEKLWSHAFPGYIDGWPVFSGNTMLLTARGQIFGIKARTGEVVWQTPDNQTTFTHPEYITGVALQGNLAYALRYDAAVVGFDPETGEQVGIIQMMPDRTLEDDKGYVRLYTIATSDRFVAVYYGNSQELIVFEKIEP